MPNLSSLITKFLYEYATTSGEKTTLRALMDAASKTLSETIAGDKTLSGQLELTNQLATGNNSAMTRGLGDSRWVNASGDTMGQLELNAQAATNATSALTRGLGDSRYNDPNVSVSAYKSTNQTGTTASDWTKITFDTEEWDIGGDFTSSRFTSPVARKIRVTAIVTVSTGTVGDTILAVYKNGIGVKRLESRSALGNSDSIGGSVKIDCAIGDYLEIFFYSMNSRTIDGTPTKTFCQFEATN